MSADFHLIDFRSQAATIQSLLRGTSAEQKIEWLSSHGKVTPVPTRFSANQIFRFQSALGLEHLFFISEDEFVFIGDHTTYTMTGKD